MSMSRKNYVDAAERIRLSGYDDETRRILAKEFADFFAADNGRFNRSRFFSAAGIEYRGNPGKFDNDLDHAMYLLALDGADAECGDSSVYRWYGLMTGVTRDDTGTLSPTARQIMRRDSMSYPLHVIVSEDSQGFVSVDYYDSAKEAEEAWEEIEEECAEMYGEED
jgi:hypothetical protein